MYNGTTCCLLANASHSFLDNPPLWPLPTHPVCGQTYADGLHDAASDVYVTFDFCWNNCGGIGLSKSVNTGDWIAPMVQFVLPAVIFSATIPRRKSVTLKNLFRARGSSWDSTLKWTEAVLRYTLLVAILDTVIWIVIIVVGAGPFIVGGLYEAWLDWRIINHVWGCVKDGVSGGAGAETTSQSVELLVIVVSGNLTELEWDESNYGNRLQSPIEQIVESLSFHRHVKSVDPFEPCPSTQLQPYNTSLVPCTKADPNVTSYKRLRLLSLLNAQADFGASVGAPVLFYLGAFIYTIIDLQSDPSNQDSAIALAYGVEWMIIVHVAIVSGCLLASTNSATASAIVGQNKLQADKREHHPVTSPRVAGNGHVVQALFRDGSRLQKRWLDVVDMVFSNNSQTQFQPTWMWRRGATKRMWLKRSAAWQQLENERKAVAGQRRYPPRHGLWQKTKDCIYASTALNLSALKWGFIWLGTFILVTVPPAVGALVSWNTPPVGLSCRSLTFIVYALAQTLLSLHYMHRINFHYEAYPDRRAQHWLLTGLTHNRWNVPWIFLSLLSCIGGTVMQLVGVFRNCFCYTTAQYWLNLGEAAVDLATDTGDARNSQDNWISMGWFATAFMCATSVSGWWYQRFVRARFEDIVDRLFPIEPPDSQGTTISAPAPAPTTPALSATQPLLIMRPSHATDHGIISHDPASPTSAAAQLHVQPPSTPPSGHTRSRQQSSTSTFGHQMGLLETPPSRRTSQSRDSREALLPAPSYFPSPNPSRASSTFSSGNG